MKYQARLYGVLKKEEDKNKVKVDKPSKLQTMNAMG
jgi:hypothetical protein